MCCCGNDGFFNCLARAMYMTQKVALCLAAVSVVTCLVTSLVIAGGVGIGLGYHYCVVEAKSYELNLQTFQHKYNNQKPANPKKPQNLTNVRAGIGTGDSDGEDLAPTPLNDSDGETVEIKQRAWGERSGEISYGEENSPGGNDWKGEEGFKRFKGDKEPYSFQISSKSQEGEMAGRERKGRKKGRVEGGSNPGESSDSLPFPLPSDGAARHEGQKVRNEIRKDPHYSKDLQDSDDTGNVDNKRIEFKPISKSKSGLIWPYVNDFNFHPYNQKQYQPDFNKSRRYFIKHKPENNKFLSGGGWKASSLMSKLRMNRDQT